MLTVQEIVQMMNDQAEQIARHLLPGGKNEGREWVVGSIDGEPGRSMKVCISGSKVGVWSDFAAGTSGDLLDLWRETRGLGNNKSTLEEVKQYLGIQESPLDPAKRKVYRKPSPPKEAKKVVAGSAVMTYLTEKRKLTPETIAAYKIGEIVQVGPWEGWKKQEPMKGPFIVFPFFRGDVLLGVKYLHLERKDGKKMTLVEKDCEPTCFGWHVINPASREVVVCEGELDAATLFQYGFPALSVPFGGGKGDKQQWVDCDWQYLEPFDTIYLCMDNDKEGEAATAEVIQRLGVHRCRIVTLPRKDANQCLQEGVTTEEIAACFAAAKFLEPEELKRASHFTKEVTAEFYPEGGRLPGFDMPWAKIPFRFLRGEVTMYNGVNGHGKSLLTGQISISAATQGEKSCIASMEMLPQKTLFRMVRQAAGKRCPERQEISDCLDWMGENIWLFHLVGTAKAERMMQVFEYAYRRHGIKQFVIDSLMKCGIAEDDYRGQKAFIETLCDFANKTGAHIHLVVHPRKGDDESRPVGKMDAKGTGAISDLMFNSFSMWRNKSKEHLIRAHANNEPLPKGETIDDILKQPDAILIIDKAKYVEGAEGKYFLWYDDESMQYHDRPGQPPISVFDEPSVKNPPHYTEDAEQLSYPFE